MKSESSLTLVIPVARAQSKFWRKVGEWHILLKVVGAVLAVVVSLCSLYFLFHEPSKATPSGWRVSFQKTIDGATFTIEPIPGATRILPQTFQPAEPLHTEVLTPPVPLPRPKPKMWERNYAVWVPDGDIGDRRDQPKDPDRMQLKKEWRSCDLPDRHPICERPSWVRRDAKPLYGY